MANGSAEPLDFSDLGGRRIWPPAERLDFSDIGGRRVGEAEPMEGYFARFGDLGQLSVEHHPEWLKERKQPAAPAQPQYPTAPATPGEPTKPFDFSDIGGRRIWQALSRTVQQIHGPDPKRADPSANPHTPRTLAQPPAQPQRSTWQQILDLHDAIDAAEMRTAVGAGKDLWETAKGAGSLVKPPDFMLHPIQQRPRTLGEAISQGAQAGAYETGLTSLRRAIKGYYDVTQQNIQRAEQAADKGDTTGVFFNSAAAGLPIVGPLIGGLYEEAQTNPDPFEVAGKGISRVAQAASMAPERSFIPNPVSAITKGLGRIGGRIGPLPQPKPFVSARTAEEPGPSVATPQSPPVEAPKRPLTHRADVKEFHTTNPGLKGKVVVHHAIDKTGCSNLPRCDNKRDGPCWGKPPWYSQRTQSNFASAPNQERIERLLQTESTRHGSSDTSKSGRDRCEAWLAVRTTQKEVRDEVLQA